MPPPCRRPAVALPQAFPSVSEEQLAALIPGKGGLVMSKLNNRAVVYSLDGGNPLFFDPDGRGGLLPTVSGGGGAPGVLSVWRAWWAPVGC